MIKKLLSYGFSIPDIYGFFLRHARIYGHNTVGDYAREFFDRRGGLNGFEIFLTQVKKNVDNILFLPFTFSEEEYLRAMNNTIVPYNVPVFVPNTNFPIDIAEGGRWKIMDSVSVLGTKSVLLPSQNTITQLIVVNQLPSPVKFPIFGIPVTAELIPLKEKKKNQLVVINRRRRVNSPLLVPISSALTEEPSATRNMQAAIQTTVDISEEGYWEAMARTTVLDNRPVLLPSQNTITQLIVVNQLPSPVKSPIFGIPGMLDIATAELIPFKEKNQLAVINSGVNSSLASGANLNNVKNIRIIGLQNFSLENNVLKKKMIKR